MTFTLLCTCVVLFLDLFLTAVIAAGSAGTGVTEQTAATSTQPHPAVMTQPAARAASATGHLAATGDESGALSAATLTGGAATGAGPSQTVSLPPAQLHRQVCHFQYVYRNKHAPPPLPMPFPYHPSPTLTIHPLRPLSQAPRPATHRSVSDRAYLVLMPN